MQMKVEQLIEQSKPFLSYVVDWVAGLPEVTIGSVVHGEPERVAVISVDVINGFCYEGPLSSPRVANIVEPITGLFNKSHAAGVRNFILTQDSHVSDSVEFESYPPHCIRGTAESETVAAFKQLPFWNLFQVMPKQSIHSAIGTGLDAWLDAHPEVNTFITVGDCTDLCTYQLAMHLKLRAVAANRKARVILPADCVDTYDLPVSIAQEIGAVPHDGDLLHHIFLYSMMLNSIEVVAKIV
jgi:nicotinamidase-related amidase